MQNSKIKRCNSSAPIVPGGLLVGDFWLKGRRRHTVLSYADGATRI